MRVDCSAAWLSQVAKLVDGFNGFLDEFESLLSGSEILMARTQGVGVLPAALAINAGVNRARPARQRREL